MLDVELPGPMMVGWGLTEALCYLNHMERRGEVEKLAGEDTDRWQLVDPPRGADSNPSSPRT
jgi:hypothetical protein